MWPRLRFVAPVLAGVALGSWAPGCGSRSGLEPPCSDGIERACSDECGSGTRLCVDGVWSDCQVPVRVDSCEDACGTGTRRCENGSLGECIVAPVLRECRSACGSGTESCEGGQWGLCTAPRPLPPVLEAVIRDFSEAHPDFQEGRVDRDRAIVEQWLGDDGKPVYAAGLYGSSTTTGPDNFDQWFRDVEGINLSRPLELPLTVSAEDERLFVFDGIPFFPIDGELLGNEGFPRNYHFTLETTADFDYMDGETFRFESDDDVWVFVNGYRIIDLGGVHARESASVNLDDIAAAAGIAPGNRYSLNLFYAERQTFGSNFFVQTSIANLGRCPGEL